MEYTALTDVWTMSVNGDLLSWTIGDTYKVTNNGESFTINANEGEFTMPKGIINPDLMKDVFGIVM
jgi:hypothetical protein